MQREEEGGCWMSEWATHFRRRRPITFEQGAETNKETNQLQKSSSEQKRPKIKFVDVHQQQKKSRWDSFR